LRVTGVALSKRFLFSLHPSLLNAFLIVYDAPFNGPALEQNERFQTIRRFLSSCPGYV
jgi:hypothetical protein